MKMREIFIAFIPDGLFPVERNEACGNEGSGGDQRTDELLLTRGWTDRILS
jgi:hypothetical protein